MESESFAQSKKFCTVIRKAKTIFYLTLAIITEEVILPEGTTCDIYGCEFDYSSNTYRLMVILSFETKTIGENFLIIKVDGSTGYPKILSVK